MNCKTSIYLIKIFVFSLLFSVIFCQNSRVDYLGEVRADYVISGQEYIASDDGTLLMYVNIWGHVKNPGTYLVYEGIDLITLISLAGGPQTGANLNNIKLIHNNKNDQVTMINLNKYIDNRTSISINPHDTIYIKESLSSYIFSQTNILSTILQIVNITYVMTKF